MSFLRSVVLLVIPMSVIMVSVVVFLFLLDTASFNLGFYHLVVIFVGLALFGRAVEGRASVHTRLKVAVNALDRMFVRIDTAVLSGE